MPSTTDLEKVYSEYVTASLKNLIENRHLYQSVKLTDDVLLSRFESVDLKDLDRTVFAIVKKKTSQNWHIWDPGNRRLPLVDDQDLPLGFSVPDVKIFCGSCDRIEAFNALSAEDFLSRRGGALSSFQEGNHTIQVFVLSLQCQACKGAPEVFLVRRSGNKLTLSGRAPIEHVEVPRVLPKRLTRYYSGALIAHQSGHTLAGNFLLRVLVEQWVRSRGASGHDAQVKDLLQEYLDSLPTDFKNRFPSLSEVYSRLSEDMHSALGSEAVFDASREDILTHFDARRLYHLDCA